MQFQVPQFIEIEDKIFGPFTFKQFVYLAGGAGISFILYKAFPFPVAILFIAPIVLLTLALAFYRINKKPFIYILEAALKYSFQKKLYIWKKQDKKIRRTKQNEHTETFVSLPRLSESKLKDIAWSLDVHESIYSGEEREKKARAQKTETGDFKL